ncbi:DUF4387 family protein [Paraburkholderia caribensis]|uniref:DUF4387 family protein n=1 Tax=Paraburkholderia caribensis TaxID=75105 RepID=UPI0034D1CFEB
MVKSPYRVMSACGGLGSGMIKPWLRTVMSARTNVLVVDGSAAQFADHATMSDDLRAVIEAGVATDGPVIIGNCGASGANRDVDALLAVARTVFGELDVSDMKVAVIRSEVSAEVLIDAMRASALHPFDSQPGEDEVALRDSTFVGQMGVHPIFTALASGAKFVFAARACGASLFAADMIRHGIPSGLAYHAGQILSNAAFVDEAGLCEGLSAEILEDGKAVFRAQHSTQPFTAYSLAAHSQSGWSHPHLHPFPEGVLASGRTEYFAVDTHTAGLSSSVFYHSDEAGASGIKLEGARRGASTVPDEGTVRHVLQNGRTVCEALFPIEHFDVKGDEWRRIGRSQAAYFELGELAADEDLDEKTRSVIEDAPPRAASHDVHRLSDITRAIRCVSAGPHRLTIDIFFASEDQYEMALRSNLFCARRLAKALDIQRSSLVGTYFIDSCSAIKLTLERQAVQSLDPPLQSRVERLVVPVHAS